jgi:hypothetical protein
MITESASVELHLSIVEAPRLMLVGVALNSMVGAGAAVGAVSVGAGRLSTGGRLVVWVFFLHPEIITSEHTTTIKITKQLRFIQSTSDFVYRETRPIHSDG